jgi:hypothetical protein
VNCFYLIPCIIQHMWTGYCKLLYVPKIDRQSTASGSWQWCFTELQSRTNNLEMLRYFRNVDSVGYISACAIHSIGYRLLLKISIYLLFTLLSHLASSSPWLYWWPAFSGNYCWCNLCLISEPKFPFCCVTSFLSLT